MQVQEILNHKSIEITKKHWDTAKLAAKREQLINALMTDFANMFPDNDTATTRLMHITLSGLATKDLEILVRGLEKN